MHKTKPGQIQVIHVARQETGYHFIDSQLPKKDAVLLFMLEIFMHKMLSLFSVAIKIQIWILTKKSVKVNNYCHLLGLELMKTFSAECWGGSLQFCPWPSLLPYSMTSTCPNGTLHFNKYLWPVVMVPLLS